jgi:cyclic pyranopterin phosphate synthase
MSHLDEQGQARMVDVGGKTPTDRVAVAESFVALEEGTRAAFFGGHLPKGDAVAVARVAAIQAVKQTSALIPLCHPLDISSVTVDIGEAGDGVRIVVTVSTTGRTGVEMEALTGAAVGALTVYDMVKGIERGAVIGPVQLLSKTGGVRGDWAR